MTLRNRFVICWHRGLKKTVKQERQYYYKQEVIFIDKNESSVWMSVNLCQNSMNNLHTHNIDTISSIVFIKVNYFPENVMTIICHRIILFITQIHRTNNFKDPVHKTILTIIYNSTLTIMKLEKSVVLRSFCFCVLKCSSKWTVLRTTLSIYSVMLETV